MFLVSYEKYGTLSINVNECGCKKIGRLSSPGFNFIVYYVCNNEPIVQCAKYFWKKSPKNEKCFKSSPEFKNSKCLVS